jgi:oxygen-dependent protoporphyrinogen oxidase
VFLTVRSGLGRLVDALAQRPTVVMGDPVVGVAPGWQATLRSGRTLTADAVVLACPAAAAATLLAPIAPTPAATLNEIRMTSVVLTTLAYAARDVTGSGFLVPRPEGRLISAATWVGSKWPHLATPGRLVIRASSGRSDDTRAMEMADGDLIDALHQELTAAMGLTDKRPIEATVHRWPEAFPQFDVGHLSRIEAVENALPPGLALAGAYLRGVGLATCIAGARAAAQQLCDT